MDSTSFMPKDDKDRGFVGDNQAPAEEAINEEDKLVTETCVKEELSKDADRETWANQIESVLSLVGFTVGLGNIWRFPYFCYRNGGGVAIIPFLIFLVVCGCPLYYLEVCLGQFSGKSIVKIWSICPLFKGLGAIGIIVSIIYLWYFGVAIGWVIYYCVCSFFHKLPWSTCDNDWNTDACIDATTNLTEKAYAMNTDNLVFETAGAQFWERHVLRKSDGIYEFGTLEPKIAGCLMLGWFIVFACLAKGVKSVGKVVYVTATLPYILLTVLLIRGVTLDGAWEGLKIYLSPDWSRLKTGQIWVESAIQCFFSLGAAWGTVITMASFNKFHQNALRSSVIVCVTDGFTAILGGAVVFSVLGYLSKQTGTPLDQLPFSGPGLAFVAYPEALSRLPFPNVWAVLFFVTLIFVGIDTQFGAFETLCNPILDWRPDTLRHRRTMISAMIAVLLFIPGLLLVTSAGIYWFILVDWYFASFAISLTALCECVLVSWLYGANRFCSDIAHMSGRHPSFFLNIAWCFVLPTIITGILFATAYTMSAPSIGEGEHAYQFPEGAVVIGNIIAFGPIVVCLGIAIYQIMQQTGTLKKKLLLVIKPSCDWVPNDEHAKALYDETPYKYSAGIRNWFLHDILGIKQPEESKEMYKC